MSLRIFLNGSLGRMGAAIRSVAADCDCTIAAAVDAGDDLPHDLGQADVVVDFSVHTATLPIVRLAATAGIPCVIGTTGHSADAIAAIREFRRSIPLVWAGNYSVGVNVLLHLTETAAQVLGPAFETELLELHHRHKVDAPSGTAINLLDAIGAVRDLPAEAIRHGRHGTTGARAGEEIGVHAVRGGDVVGEHTVFFFGSGERLELTHKASDRAIFARGALRAARWVCGREPGLFDMRDVLGLRRPQE